MTQISSHSQLQIEQSLLSAALQSPERLAGLRISEITSDLVQTSRQWEFVTEYWDKYKALPTDTTIRAAFGDDWQPIAGEFEYWLTEFKRITIARKAQAAMMDSLQAFDDPEKAVADLINRLSAIKAIGDDRVVASDRGILQRLEKYQLRKEIFTETAGEQVWGIRTGFEVINATRIGWMPGELIGIFARPGVGKTWVLAREAVEAWLQGYRVLFISPEMPESQIALRFDVIMAHKLGIPLSHRATFIGSPVVEAAYTELAARVGPNERWWTIDSVEGGAVSLNHIRGFTAQFSPDMVYIDGVSLLQTRKTTEWEAMKENMYGLKYFTTSNQIPTMVTHQSQRKSTSGAGKLGPTGQVAISEDFKMPNLSEAAFGDAFVQAASTVLTMCADQYRRDMRWYSVRKVRDREPVDSPRLGMFVDYDHGRIIDLSRYGDDFNGLAQEVNRLAAG